MNHTLAHWAAFHQHSIGAPLSSPLFERCPEFERCEGLQRASLSISVEARRASDTL